MSYALGTPPSWPPLSHDEDDSGWAEADGGCGLAQGPDGRCGPHHPDLGSELGCEECPSERRVVQIPAPRKGKKAAAAEKEKRKSVVALNRGFAFVTFASTNAATKALSVRARLPRGTTKLSVKTRWK